MPLAKRTLNMRPRKAASPRILSLSAIMQMVRKAKAAGKRVVTTNGCFDILHVGHARYLAFAREQGDLLIVGVNSDSSVRRNKGPARPIVSERERAELVASLRSVDAVYIFDETTPDRWLGKLRPDIHVKGADREMSEIVERRTVERFGGRVIRAPYIKGKSTSTILARIKS